MFDDPKQKEPEDIFGGTDTASAPGNLPTGMPSVSSVSPAGIPQAPQKPPAPMGGLRPEQPRPPLPAQPLQQALPAGERVMLEEPKQSWAKLLITIIVAVLIVGGVGGWLLFRGYFLKSQQVKPGVEKQTTTVEDQETSDVFPEPEDTGEVPAEEQQEAEVPADMDGDGLTDDEELMVGTDPSLADTDGDQLGDKDEVKVYKTDPLNPDTDGDTFLDGEEVKNGYDPKGKGKLFEVPAPASE